MSEIKKSTDVIELDVLHNIFLANANKMEKDLPVDMLYQFLVITENNGLTIRKELERVYRKLEARETNKLINMLISGCNEYKEILHNAIYSDGKKDVISIEDYKAYTKAEKEMYEYLWDYASMPDEMNTFGIKIDLNLKLALFFKSLADENESLTYENIHYLEGCIRGTETADNLFKLAKYGLMILANELELIQKEYLAVGKEFKEYLSSEEFLGKRKAMKR